MNNDPTIQLYLDTVIAQIKFQEAHAEVRRELESHIAELIDAEINRGLPNNTATENALRRMGDPIEVGQKLHLAHQPKLDWYLTGLAITLFALYALSRYRWMLSLDYFIHFLSNILSGNLDMTAYYLLNFLLPLVLGSALFAVLTLWNYQKIANRAGWIYGFMLLAIALFAGVTAAFWGAKALFDPTYVTHLNILQPPSNSSMRSPDLPTWDLIGLQTTIVFLAFAPLVLIVGFAGIVSRKLWNKAALSLVLIGSLALPVIGFSAINSRYAAITFAVASIVLMISSKARWWQITTATVVLFGSIYTFYQASVTTFNGTSVYSGHFFSDYSFTDQLFTILWLMLSVLIWVRTMSLVRQITDNLGRLLGTGIATLLGTESLLNTVGTPGLALFPIGYYDGMVVDYFLSPIAGIFWMIKTIAAIGLIVSIYRRRTLIASRSSNPIV